MCSVMCSINITWSRLAAVRDWQPSGWLSTQPRWVLGCCEVRPGGELVMSEGLCCGELARQAAATKLSISERGWQGLDWWCV